jgi:hypothetical protein
MVQHLVSRVLLRQWSKYPEGKGPISGLDLDTLTQRTGSVKMFGGVDDQDLAAPDDIEKVWSNDVEKRLPYAFARLAAGELVNDQAAIQTVKNCIVLHWARGFVLPAILSGLIPSKADEITSSLLEKFTAAEIMHALTGRYLVSSNMTELLKGRIYSDFMENIRIDRFVDKQFLEQYRKGQELVEPYSLEIWYSPDNEFLISDTPVVSYNKDTDKVGVLQDVAWSKADALFMPLGPHHVVALAKKPDVRAANARMVERLNVYQVRGALHEIFYRPGSGLGDIIAEALRNNQER